MAVGDNKCENSCRATGHTNPDQSSTNSLNVKFEGRFLSQVTQRKCIIEIFYTKLKGCGLAALPMAASLVSNYI